MNNSYELSSYSDIKWAVAHDWSFIRIKNHFTYPVPPDTIILECIKRAEEELRIEHLISTDKAAKLIYE